MGLDVTRSGHNQVTGSSGHINVPWVSIKGRKFLDQLDGVAAQLPKSWDRKIWSWVPRAPEPRMCWRGGPAVIYHTDQMSDYRLLKNVRYRQLNRIYNSFSWTLLPFMSDDVCKSLTRHTYSVGQKPLIYVVPGSGPTNWLPKHRLVPYRGSEVNFFLATFLRSSCLTCWVNKFSTARKIRTEKLIYV
jgi:hypothetical protein